MPPKNNFSYSVNPELYERSQQPASTIAMGMKSSQASSLAWQDQVRREQALQDRWAAAYDPTATQEARKDEALQHTLTRQAARQEQYRGVETNPELHEILYQQDLEELQRQAACEADASRRTVTFNTNPRATATATITKATAKAPAPPAGGKQAKALPPATGPIPYHDGSARSSSGGDGPGSAHAHQNHVNEDGQQKSKFKSKTEQYLTVRADSRTMTERFPQGPRTGTQVVGWQAYHANGDGEATGSTNSAVYQTAKTRPSKGPYRRPEDATHAQLMGYDLEEK